MPNIDFFSNLGIYVLKDFLDVSTCASLCSNMSSSPYFPADLINDDSPDGYIDKNFRKVSQTYLSSLTTSEVLTKLQMVIPMLNNHFNLALADFEDPQFLIYREGDFFLPHQDNSNQKSKAVKASQRKVSVAIFLNDCAQEPGPELYCGGALTFYGLLTDPQWKKFGFPLIGERGALIAFRSDVVHEVKPVTHGTRYSIVTWYH